MRVVSCACSTRARALRRRNKHDCLVQVRVPSHVTREMSNEAEGDDGKTGMILAVSEEGLLVSQVLSYISLMEHHYCGWV